MGDMDREMREFERQLQKWAEKSAQRTEDVLIGAAIDVYSSVIQRTPVDSGRLRGNWQSAFGTPTVAQIERYETGYAAQQIREAYQLMRRNGGGLYWFSNNLPYAYRIEFQGWSRQKAPAGMVRVSLTDASAALQRALADNR